jgi:replication-associated recombination protein RarA
MSNSYEVIWEQKYRPNDIDEIILPIKYRKLFKNMIKTGVVPNMILYGRPGTGKSSIANVLVKMTNATSITINTSQQGKRGIGLLDESLESFCYSASANGERKIVVLEEADRMTPELQDAFRGFIEKYSSNVIFILTCNKPNRIAEAIRTSRLLPINFTYTPEQIEEIKPKFVSRVLEILEEENVRVDSEDAVKDYVEKNLPDMRNILKTLHSIAIMNAKKLNTGKIRLRLPEDIEDLSNTLTFDRLMEVVNKNDTKEAYVLSKTYSSDDIFELVIDNIDEFVNKWEVLECVNTFDLQNSQVEFRDINMCVFLDNLHKIINGGE